MRTTINIEDDLLSEAERLTQQRSRSRAVNAALAEWVRMRKLQELKTLRSTMNIPYDVAELRALEVAETREAPDDAD